MSVQVVGETVLENDNLAVAFGRDGSIRSVLNKQTGTDHIACSERARLIRLVLPVEGWDGHHLDNSDQTTEIEVWVEGDCSHIRISYHAGLSCGQGTFDIDVVCSGRLKGTQLTLAISIKNNSPYPLTEVWYPWLGGLNRLSANPQDTYLLVPGFFRGQNIQAPFDQLDSANGWLTTAPGGGRRLWLYPRNMQWVDFYSADEGMYYAMHDPTPRVKAFLMQRDHHSDPSFAVTWIRYPHLEPGETLEADNYVLSTHEGDWHQGADLYRTWLKTWMRPCDIAPRIRESIGWHFTFVRHGDGSTVRAYRDLPALSEDARKAGLDALQVFGFHEAGMDRGYPNYEPIAEFGGEAELRRALQEIRQQEGRVALYQAGSAANLFCGPYQANVQHWAVKSGLGELIRSDWTWNLYDTNRWRREQPFLLMCYGSDWRHLLVETAERFIGTYGATAVHFDHIGEFDFYPCYDSRHRHRKPDAAPSEIIAIFQEIRRRVKEIDPAAAIHCEGLSELSGPWVDVHWGQNSLDRMPDVIRYTLPDLLYTTLIQENDYERAARAFVYGILFDVCIELGTGTIGSYPEFSAYIAQLAQLRKRLAPFLVYGTFRDQVGLRAEAEVLVKVFVSMPG